MNATLFALPKLGTTIAGGVYAGIMTGKDGAPYALLKLPFAPPNEHSDIEGRPDGFLSWSDACAWAQSHAAELPTLAEAAVLLKMVPGTLPEETWTSDAGVDDMNLAWLANFHDNDLSRFQKSARAEAMAVRRMPLDELLAAVKAPPARRVQSSRPTQVAEAA